MNKAKELIKKYWLKALITAGFVLLVIITFSKCNENKELLKERNAAKEKILEKDRLLQASEVEFTKKDSQKQQEIERKDSAIAAKEKVIAASNSQLKTTTAQLRRILKGASDQPLDLTDSINRLVHFAIDSAISQIDQMSLTIAGLEVQISELENLNIQKDTLQAQQLAAMNLQLRATRDAYLNLLDEYKKVFGDLQKLAKKNKRSKALNKTLAAVAAALGTALILK
jgi:hypothetical protein